MQVERKNEQHRYQYHKHRPSQHPQNLKLIDDHPHTNPTRSWANLTDIQKSNKYRKIFLILIRTTIHFKFFSLEILYNSFRLYLIENKSITKLNWLR